VTQRELFRLSRDEQYERWRASENGAAVFTACIAKAKRLRRAGVDRHGIDAVIGSVRFDRAVQCGRDEDGFKVNNTYSSRLAREIMETHPDLSGMFETRVLRS